MSSNSNVQWIRRTLWQIGFGVSLLSSGCSGVHLHSEANYQIATKAQTAFDDAKLASSVAEERSRLNQILQRELAAVRRQTLATRDAHLLAILVGDDRNTSWDQFDRTVQGRLQELLGADTSVFPKLDAALNRLKSALERLPDVPARPWRPRADLPAAHAGGLRPADTVVPAAPSRLRRVHRGV
jgi:hypothetical protein